MVQCKVFKVTSALILSKLVLSDVQWTSGGLLELFLLHTVRSRPWKQLSGWLEQADRKPEPRVEHKFPLRSLLVPFPSCSKAAKWSPGLLWMTQKQHFYCLTSFITGRRNRSGREARNSVCTTLCQLSPVHSRKGMHCQSILISRKGRKNLHPPTKYLCRQYCHLLLQCTSQDEVQGPRTSLLWASVGWRSELWSSCLPELGPPAGQCFCHPPSVYSPLGLAMLQNWPERNACVKDLLVFSVCQSSDSQSGSSSGTPHKMPCT